MSDPNQAGRITADQALSDIATSPAEAASIELSWQMAHENAAVIAHEKWIRCKGLEEHFIHKGWWSGVLLATIVYMVVFESILIWMVGLGIWNFEKYSWLVPTIMIQFLVQIVGLGLLVVKSLFESSKS